MPRRAVVLLSGGMDSATCLAMALRDGYRCHALSFSYGQRHGSELTAAAKVATGLGATEHRVIEIDTSVMRGSALTEPGIEVPDAGEQTGIPATYVPARNTLFLSFGLAVAEVIDAGAIYAGMNAVDYSGYPDCRPEYVSAFQAVVDVATRRTIEGEGIEIRTPLMYLSKAEIIRVGRDLGVDFGQTVSCYRADDTGRACGICDACHLRREGFRAASIPDPTRYRAQPVG